MHRVAMALGDSAPRPPGMHDNIAQALMDTTGAPASPGPTAPSQPYAAAPSMSQGFDQGSSPFGSFRGVPASGWASHSTPMPGWAAHAA